MYELTFYISGKYLDQLKYSIAKKPSGEAARQRASRTSGKFLEQGG
ncbi:MAG: hypothetical protein AB8Y71_02365 [Coxiella endosymbiont of Haemaphysalis qinghaiensis]